MSKDEIQWWQNFKRRRLVERGTLDQNQARIDELINLPGQSSENQALLTELKSYTSSIASNT